MKSGGGLKAYLENLELAEFIRSVTSYDSQTMKYPKYKVSDEFSWFFIKYVQPHSRLIRDGGGPGFLKAKLIPNWNSWFGFTFENYCVGNAMLVAELAGFADKVAASGPYLRKSQPGGQVDLIFKRTDKVITICEMKYSEKKVTAEIIHEMNVKIAKLNLPSDHSLEKILIAPNGASDELIKSRFFSKILTIEDFFK